jgi:hypothetical protein
LVSQTFNPDSNVNELKTTHMFTQFGQFLDHDITLTPEGQDEHCCEHKEKFHHKEKGSTGPRQIFQNGSTGPRQIFQKGPTVPLECFPIKVSVEDNFFGQPKIKQKCLDFTRSVPFCIDQFKLREQMNGITAFIDASNVYGNNDAMAKRLRTLSGGKLLVCITS